VRLAVAAPANDNFADASIISYPLPFNAYDDTIGATFEASEPNPSCGFGTNPSTIWYSYTSTVSESLTARVSYVSFTPMLAIYTGYDLTNLSEIGCASFSPQIAFQALAGSTYYFQVSGLYDGTQGPMPFSLETTPPPAVSINYSPYDPSIYDNVNFYANIYDPAGINGGTYAWDLGDGTTSTDTSLYHQYEKDGDYLAHLLYTTSDGRSAATSTTVQVRTRDVAISKFGVPYTARSYQTKEISIEVKNRRYSDNVQVQLYKGLPGGGEQLIGTLTIYVPARANRSTLFKFSYTFTPEDAAVGKAIFRAVATIAGGHDAFPADNTAIRSTLVTGATIKP
jgi:hypothetical protein